MTYVPSPLEGEGGRRPDEGDKREKASNSNRPPHPNPLPPGERGQDLWKQYPHEAQTLRDFTQPIEMESGLLFFPIVATQGRDGCGHNGMNRTLGNGCGPAATRPDASPTWNALWNCATRRSTASWSAAPTG